jgi:ribosomal-protein-alanine N-acetyltransferase
MVFASSAHAIQFAIFHRRLWRFLVDGGRSAHQHMVTLEVRVSNETAQALYRKYGMTVTGKRKKYYSDNGEDAFIMSTPVLTSAEYQRLMQELKIKLFTRLSS